MDESPRQTNDGLAKSPPRLEDILKSLAEAKFHGSLTIHYANGIPRKIEYKMVADTV